MPADESRGFLETHKMDWLSTSSSAAKENMWVSFSSQSCFANDSVRVFLRAASLFEGKPFSNHLQLISTNHVCGHCLGTRSNTITLPSHTVSLICKCEDLFIANSVYLDMWMVFFWLMTGASWLHNSVWKIRNVGMPFWFANKRRQGRWRMLYSALGTAQHCAFCQGSDGSDSISIWPLGDSLPCGVLWEMWRGCPRKVGHDLTVANWSILWKMIWNGWEGYWQMFKNDETWSRGQRTRIWVIPCVWVWLNRVHFFLGIWRDPSWSVPTISSPIWWDQGIWVLYEKNTVHVLYVSRHVMTWEKSTRASVATENISFCWGMMYLLPTLKKNKDKHRAMYHYW